jgi:hypothetical protein
MRSLIHSRDQELTMPSHGSIRFARPGHTNPWSTDDIRRLREFAEQGLPLNLISTTLRRSESAIRNKAGMHGISLQRSAEVQRSKAG